MRRLASTVLVSLALLPPPTSAQDADRPLFELLRPEDSGVAFSNVIRENEALNVLEYEYFYNGGGVAIGDLDGDQLPEIFFTANTGQNALYRNAGGLKFEDVTGRAGVGGREGWTTGVTLADVNGDGLLDIYVCRSGQGPEDSRRNELFINRGNLRFREQAREFGLDDPGYTTHAAFFDYDADGDLDLFLLNHNVKRLARFDVAYMKGQRDPYGGDRLYRNDGGRYVDVSQQAGIIQNPLGFGLSATVGDFNQDGKPDVYVANDYIEDDYLYINQGDGTFREDVRTYLDHTSYYSMGADFADINADGLPDLVTLDMLPEDNRRQKLLKGPDAYDVYQLMRSYGFHHQHMRNMLHLNNGDGSFSEIGQLAGISNTDWSWAALLADFDNDGYRDLFVSNGYVRDYTNMDFLKYIVPEAQRVARERGESLSMYDLVRKMPSTQLRNYVYRNRGDLTFEPRMDAWGIDAYSLSNGAAYGDLDGDGDLDLAVNNINQAAFIYRNNAEREAQNHFLQIRLEGSAPNTLGIGAVARVTLPDGRVLHQELNLSRGYQSSVDPVMHFGLGTAASVDVAVRWPDGRREVRRGVAANATVRFRQQDATTDSAPAADGSIRPFRRVQAPGEIPFRHEEDDFVDFKREPLLPHMESRLGPALVSGDVDGDRLDDVFVGGARGQASVLFVQQPDGTYEERATFTAHADFEDVAATLFDANGDGDLDLYVVSGGNHETADPLAYQDRLYANDGAGRFTYMPDALPELAASGSVARAHDVDSDGDLDLFVGGHVLPGRYPLPPRSYLLENEGGRFVDATARLAPALMEVGMVSDATWADLDGDGASELAVVGEWMPVRIFRWAEGRFLEATDAFGLANTHGWWNCVVAEDLDGDGDLDLIAGNRGLNAQMQATDAEAATVHAVDLDANGTLDPIIAYFIQGQSYPMASRDELLDQVPALKKRFTDYESYADVTVADLLSPSQREEAVRLEASRFATTLFENRGGTFAPAQLPIDVQFAPVNCVLTTDVNEDGIVDLLLVGNNFGVRAESGRYDAGKGLVLLGNGDLTFKAMKARESGFEAAGDARKMVAMRTASGPRVVVANNDAPLQSFERAPQP